MSPQEKIVEPIVYYHIKSDKVMQETHYHAAYEIHILESERQYLVSNQLLHLKERDVLLIKPNVIHRTFNRAQLFSTLEVPISYLKRYFTKEGIEEITQCFEKTVIRVRESDFKQLLSCVEKFKENQNDVLALVQLFYILKGNMSRSTHAENCHNSLAAKIVDFITENYKTINNLEVIMNMFFISKSYLCTLFKEYTGTSIISYINSLKIHNSLSLLSQKNLTIEEVALQSGFSSLAYFSQTFKSVMGTSPLKYRKDN